MSDRLTDEDVRRLDVLARDTTVFGVSVAALVIEIHRLRVIEKAAASARDLLVVMLGDPAGVVPQGIIRANDPDTEEWLERAAWDVMTKWQRGTTIVYRDQAASDDARDELIAILRKHFYGAP